MPQATIYDVSRRAGVSIATVSRVLNSPDQVTRETRERVLAAIDELDFIPKFEALARARKHSGRIGVFTPFFTTHSFVERLRGVVTALNGLAYQPVIYDLTSAAVQDGYLANLALTHAVDGVIVMSWALDEVKVRRLLKHQLPTVQIVISTESFSRSLSSIGHDDGAGVRMAAQYLLGRGHRCLGFVGDAAVPFSAGVPWDTKLDSFRQTLATAGVALPDAYVGVAPFSHTPMELARRHTHRLLDLPRPPTAIFASSDMHAFGVISAAQERGMAVPDDLAVMGFDDIEFAQFSGLTTIRQELKESGRRAVELLLAQLDGNTGPPQHVEMPLTLVQRATA